MDTYIFDLILAGIAIVVIYFSARKGFVEIVLQTVSLFLAAITAYKLCEPVASLVCDKFLTNAEGEFVSVISRIIIFIILLIILNIAFKALSTLLSSLIEKIPLVGTADYILGGVLGLLKAAVIIYVVCTVSYLAVVTENADSLKTIISNSYVYQFITENNPIVDLIQK